MSSKIVISVSGKGGTGKTTLTSLLLKWIIKNTDEVALVVDAGPATNLPDVLGVELENTVGHVSKDMKDQIERGARAQRPVIQHDGETSPRYSRGLPLIQGDRGDS